MDIKQSITAINKWHERYGFDIKGVVIHSMWGTYQGSINWFKNPQAKASCHYVIKADGEITMCVEEQEAAWHSGIVTTTKEKAPFVIKDNWGTNPNLITIGCELEDKRNRNWDYPSPQYLSAVNLVADICRRYNINPTPDYIIMHRQVDPINRSDPVGKWNHEEFCLDVSKLIEYDTLQLEVHPLKTTVHVRSDMKTGLNVRSGVTLKSPKHGHIKDYLLPGESCNVVGWVFGEGIEGENRWWVSEYCNYFWVGGTVEKPSDFENFEGKDGDYKMTQSEKDSLIAELEARISEVKETPVEEVVAPEPEPEVVVEETPAEPVVEEAPVEPEAASEPTPEPVVEEPKAEVNELDAIKEALRTLARQIGLKIAI